MEDFPPLASGIAHPSNDIATDIIMKVPVQDASTSNPGSRHFKCGICDKGYLRADHLSRHVNTHQTIPLFECATCKKGFARGDLLTRHSTLHERVNYDQKRRSVEGTARAAQACISCAASKLRCEGGHPCLKCRKKGLTCGYGPTARKRRTRAPIPPRHPSTPASSLRGGESRHDADVTAMDSYESMQSPIVTNGLDESLGILGSLGEYFENVLLPDPSIGNRQHDANTSSFAPRDVLDFGNDFSLDTDNADQFFNSLQNDLYDPSHWPAADDNSSVVVPPPASAVARGTAAFKKSLWCWTPESQSYAEQDNLTLAVTIPLGEQIQTEPVTSSTFVYQGMRDKLMILALDAFQRPGSAIQSPSSFPSSSVLTDLLRLFSIQQSAEIDSWIHPDLGQTEPVKTVLLAASVASAASQSHLTTVCKFGLALQEAVRIKMYSIYDNDNSLGRDLGMCQAHVLILHVGLWSGQKRKIEFAESFTQPPVTMLRRASKFRSSQYSAIHVEPTDHDDELRSKWREWLRKESFKRLVIHLFLHDAQASMALLINPLISEAEMQLPLPAAHNLWRAQSLAEWKAAYLASSSISVSYIPSVAACIHDISNLISVEGSVDFPLSCLVVLHGYWRLLWNYQQLVSLHNCTTKGDTPTSHLMITSRQYELSQMLQRFRLCVLGRFEGTSRSMVVLILELLNMYLHVSMEELQLFAGKEGVEESHRMFPRLRLWVQDGNSKKSVWSAGQILRAAKQLPPGKLRNFYAIAVYHASLTLWTYGVINQALVRSGSEGAYGLDVAEPLALDGHESELSKRFLLYGQGTPFVSPAQDYPTDFTIGVLPVDAALLTDPTAVMRVSLQILERNFKSEGRHQSVNMPPLVENLGNLMNDLSMAAGFVFRG